jgi:hypothetical protein
LLELDRKLHGIRVRTVQGVRDVWVAHRISYRECIGEIPEGLTLDHLCKNKLCVNPAHLEVVTAEENLSRVERVPKSHCKNGHPFDEANTYIRPDHGTRQCRRCGQAASRRYYSRSVGAAFVTIIAALGLAAGLFAFPARADNPQAATKIEDLQALGYVIGLRGDRSGCAFLYVISQPNGVVFADGHEPVIELNPDPNHPACVTPQYEIQANIDALLATWPPLPPPAPPVTTTDVTPPVDAPPVTTTTTAPVTTTTTDVPPAPPAATTTDAAAPTEPAAADTPQTITVTATDPTVQAQIDALNAKIDALTTKVDKLAAADAAAWDAFVAATDAGASAPDAALAARSGYLNSLYGL